jgi:hypothetical protein
MQGSISAAGYPDWPIGKLHREATSMRQRFKPASFSDLVPQVHYVAAGIVDLDQGHLPPPGF